MFPERSAADEVDPESIALAAAMASLAPVPTVNRDRLMFLAGQAQAASLAPRRANRAMAAAVLAASLAGLLAGWQLHAPGLPQIAGHGPQVPRPGAESPGPIEAAGGQPIESRAIALAPAVVQSGGNRSQPDADKLDVRRRVLLFGVDWLPSLEGAGRQDAARDRSFWELRGQLLDRDFLPLPGRFLDLAPPYPAGTRT